MQGADEEASVFASNSERLGASALSCPQVAAEGGAPPRAAVYETVGAFAENQATSNSASSTSSMAASI